MIRRCVKSFKWFRFHMRTLWMKTVNTEKALESHISEILETLDKNYHDWGLLQTNFFQYEYWVGHLRKVSRDFFRYLKLSEIEADKRNYFILKPQVKCRNISPVNQQWAKLSYFIKTQWFDGVWKVSKHSDAMMTFRVKTQLIQRRPLKAIQVKSWKLWKRTGMIGGYSKLSFLTTNTESVICGKFQAISSDF